MTPNRDTGENLSRRDKANRCDQDIPEHPTGADEEPSIPDLTPRLVEAVERIANALGTVKKTTPVVCGYCHGSGQLYVPDCHYECPHCNGKGHTYD